MTLHLSYVLHALGCVENDSRRMFCQELTPFARSLNRPLVISGAPRLAIIVDGKALQIQTHGNVSDRDRKQTCSKTSEFANTCGSRYYWSAL